MKSITWRGYRAIAGFDNLIGCYRALRSLIFFQNYLQIVIYITLNTKAFFL
ncbi:MAG: hypothetical protein RMX68_014045 [Aulosira sp. ZfuVER01]|nr:hypothetical protein [Aulosira sp. ZfuVER01]MDZ8000207.1 hypothetical protein [Aulosira sp. DedVER01a]MDZ8053425.1 hypothetical protein [Aulosira sp. ZfuCHP01]